MQDVAARDVDFTQVQSLGNKLLTALNAVRAAAPIYWSERQRAWIVTSHERVLEGFRGDLPLSSRRLERVLTVMPEPERHRIPYIQQVLPKFLISLDPPEQLRLRKLMMRAFSRKVAEGYRPFVRQVIAETLERAAAKQQVEFVEDVARRIPGRLILRLMGLSEEYFPKLRRWALALNSAFGGGGANRELLLECEQVLLEMRDAFTVEVARRRADPGEDFISSLILAEEDGQRLTDEEIIATCHLTLVAGHDTTTNSMTLGTVALAQDAAARRYVRERPEAIGEVVLELLRYVAMSTAMTRIATKDFEWGGQQIRQGDIVYLMIAGANRDPAVFAEPERLDCSRLQTQNVSFAPGMHHCIGHFLAKMQLGEFFPALLDRFEEIQILEPQLSWGTSLTFRGLRSLHVRLYPRGTAQPAVTGD